MRFVLTGLSFGETRGPKPTIALNRPEPRRGEQEKEKVPRAISKIEMAGAPWR